jgi:protein phosphatase
MKLRVGAATDVGRIRSTNEDSFATQIDQGLFVVCDGMGGAAAGELASRIGVETIVDQLRDVQPDTSGARDAYGFRPHTVRLGEAVRQANASIHAFAQGDHDREGMGTTVVGIWLAGDVASIAHVGDSRAYLWHQGEFDALTVDHSVVEAQVRAGLLKREDSLHVAHQNVLLQALGLTLDVDVELGEVAVEGGDYLLLCSDGLTRTVSDAAMGQTIADLKDPDTICRRLIDTANTAGGPDNVTVVVVEIVNSASEADHVAA